MMSQDPSAVDKGQRNTPPPSITPDWLVLALGAPITTKDLQKTRQCVSTVFLLWYDLFNSLVNLRTSIMTPDSIHRGTLLVLRAQSIFDTVIKDLRMVPRRCSCGNLLICKILYISDPDLLQGPRPSSRTQTIFKDPDHVSSSSSSPIDSLKSLQEP